MYRMLLAAIVAVPLLSGTAQALTLATKGKTNYCIVIPADAISAEQTAAKELAKYLKQVTGASFPVRTEVQAKAGTPQILVGPSRRAKLLSGKINWDDLGRDGIVMKTVGKTLVLAGGRTRGTLYAVYSFLEDTVGCRWWTGTESTIPKKPTLTVPALNVSYTPKLRYREAFYRDPLEHPEFAAKLKLNGNFYKIPAEYGNHYTIIGWCHTFYNWLPPGKYYAQHPEWYSLINGKREAGATQLCLTNEEMRKEMVRVVLEQIKANPDAGIISLSQNDCFGPCQCEKCQAIVKEEGSESGPLIRFVNSVAEEVDRAYPGTLVETLAYQYTRKPPLHVRPRNNVVVRLCSIECCFTLPLENDHNAAFRDDIIKWKAIAPNLYIWDYVTNFVNYIYPHPNLRVLAPNLRFFEKNNVIGVFEQGDSATTVGDFVRLRAWLFGHLEWNPSLDENKLRDEFMNGYYGKAGPYLSKYLDLVLDSAEKAKCRVGCYHNESSYLSVQDVNEALRLFADAEKAVADDPKMVERVRRERLPLDHVIILRYDDLNLQAKRAGVEFDGPKDPRAFRDEFIELCNKWDAKNYSEGQSFESYCGMLRSLFAPPPPKPEEIKDLPKDSYVDLQDSTLTLFNPPTWATTVDDAKASDGKAAFMPANHTQWAVQYHITDEFAKAHPGEWTVCLIARAEGNPSGGAFQYGMIGPGGEMIRMGASLEAAGGDYITLSLGNQRLKAGAYVWVAPFGDPNVVKGIYVDRVILLPAKES